MWVHGDDRLAINLARYDRLDIRDNHGQFDVIAVRDNRHTHGKDAVQFYRLHTTESHEDALAKIADIVAGVK